MSEIEINLNAALEGAAKAKCCLHDLEQRIECMKELLKGCCIDLCMKCGKTGRECDGCRWKCVQDGELQ